MAESHPTRELAGRRLIVTARGYTVATIAGYALLAATARPLTAPATVTVLLPGVVIAAWGLRRAPRRTVRAARPTIVTWFGLALLFCFWEVVAFLWGNDHDHPTLSLLADPMLDTYPGRFFGYVAWLGAGAWLTSR